MSSSFPTRTPNHQSRKKADGALSQGWGGMPLTSRSPLHNSRATGYMRKLQGVSGSSASQWHVIYSSTQTLAPTFAHSTDKRGRKEACTSKWCRPSATSRVTTAFASAACMQTSAYPSFSRTLPRTPSFSLALPALPRFACRWLLAGVISATNYRRRTVRGRAERSIMADRKCRRRSAA